MVVVLDCYYISDYLRTAFQHVLYYNCLVSYSQIKPTPKLNSTFNGDYTLLSRPKFCLALDSSSSELENIIE
jgi:hypothetical protein